MNGWLVAKSYDGDAGVSTHEALFAIWDEDPKKALQLAQDYGPRGSRVTPHIVTALSEGMLRGLKLRPGQAGLLEADRPWI